MATLIYNVTDLQNINLNLAGDYELANDIDAVASRDMYRGVGWAPIGLSGGNFSNYAQPCGDLYHTGTWTGWPDTVDLWKNVERQVGTPRPYVEGVAGTDILFDVSPPYGTPPGQTITRYYTWVDGQALESGTKARQLLYIEGTAYQGTEFNMQTFHTLQSNNYFSTNPRTGSAWTWDQAHGIGADSVQGIGIRITAGSARITNLSPALYYGGVISGVSFTGSLDGKGHKISNLYMRRWNNYAVGLFDSCDGGVRDLVLEDVTVCGDKYVGALGGYCYADGQVIEGCSSSGSVIANSYAGGLFGEIGGSSTLRRSHSSCTVETSSYAGGLLGDIYYWNDPEIEECYATGDVYAKYGAGGFVGHNFGGDHVHRCYAAGNVSGIWVVGGFVGLNRGGVIADSYALGDVSATEDTAGGFIGENEYTSGADSEVTNCYSKGLVTTPDVVGGFCGEAWSVVFTDCFWDTETSGQATSAGGEGRTTAQMKSLSNFTAWDIARTTIANPTSGYPFLGWQAGLPTTWLIYGAVSITSPRLFVPIDHKVSLELVRNVEISAGGRAFIDKEGNFHYDSRFGRHT